MKVPFETSKLYYGFPVYILGYKDDKFQYNITTSSSSYSLGDMMVIGMFKGSNAAEQIQKHREFTLNIPSKEQAFMMEKAGFLTKRDKLKILQVSYTIADTVDAPLLTACPISVECRVVAVEEYQNYLNFTAQITKRWVDNSLLDDKGHFRNETFFPLEYMGDGRARVYRELTADTQPLGAFIKKERTTKN